MAKSGSKNGLLLATDFSTFIRELNFFMRLFIILFLLAGLAQSCNTNKQKPATGFRVLLPDTLKTHRLDTLFNELTAISAQLNLPEIHTGVKGMEIRLWISSMSIPHQLVRIQSDDSIRFFRKYDYYKAEDVKIKYKLTEEISGNILKEMTDSLDQIDFTRLLSQQEIDQFNDPIADGVNYHLEIATASYYKLISYHCPGYFVASEPNNRKFLEILLMLDRYLHFYFPICTK